MPKNAQADGRTYGRTDRRTKGWEDPILKDYSGYYRGSTYATAVDWHLKVKDIVRCWSNKKLLHHSQHTKNNFHS